MRNEVKLSRKFAFLFCLLAATAFACKKEGKKGDDGSTAASDDPYSTGVPECDKAVQLQKKCAPGTPEDSLKKMAAGYRTGAKDPTGRKSVVAGCKTVVKAFESGPCGKK
jgi:hypothetical protein